MDTNKILIPDRLAVRISKLAFETPDPSCELTWEEAFDFFRKDKNYIFSVEPCFDFVTEFYDGYEYFIEVRLGNGDFVQDNDWFETYEQAREVCLEKLILIREGKYIDKMCGRRDDNIEKRRIKFIEDYASNPKKMINVKTESITDGYHTFNELYEFRKMYNALLFNEWALQTPLNGEPIKGVFNKYYVHKSWKHSDGEWCFGSEKEWFVVCAKLDSGLITNHYKAEDWDLFDIPETETSIFEYDGHTPQDTIERMREEALKPKVVEKLKKVVVEKQLIKEKEDSEIFRKENGTL